MDIDYDQVSWDECTVTDCKEIFSSLQGEASRHHADQHRSQGELTADEVAYRQLSKEQLRERSENPPPRPGDSNADSDPVPPQSETPQRTDSVSVEIPAPTFVDQDYEPHRMTAMPSGIVNVYEHPRTRPIVGMPPVYAAQGFSSPTMDPHYHALPVSARPPALANLEQQPMNAGSAAPLPFSTRQELIMSSPVNVGPENIFALSTASGATDHHDIGSSGINLPGNILMDVQQQLESISASSTALATTNHYEMGSNGINVPGNALAEIEQQQLETVERLIAETSKELFCRYPACLYFTPSLEQAEQCCKRYHPA